MNDRLPNQSQSRAHKKNVGVLKFLRKNVEQMQKDKKKSMQNIDHEMLDTIKCLEQIQHNTGHSFDYEDVYPEHRKSIKDDKRPDNYRPTKSSLVRMEVKLRKSLTEANFKVRSSEFFQRWNDSFEVDLALDDWYLKEHTDVGEPEWTYPHF